MKPASDKDKAAAKLDGVRHSLAHILAAAVKEKFPKVQLGIGPVIENGFYYDFKFPKGFTEDMLPELEKRMRAIIHMNLPFTGKKVMPAQAKKAMKDQKFKLELIDDFKKDKKPLTIYKTGDIFVDLCKGGHVKNTKEIDPEGFALSHVAGAYWKGNEKNAQLTRIYGLAFSSKAELDAYRTMIEEAKKRDHKILGPQLDLFTFSDLVGPGLPLWTPKGTILRNTLDAYVQELRAAKGYQKVEIPHITKKDLYETSGHWDKFKDELFRITTREGHEFAMKPMNCPHHTQIYKRRSWSYRDLPQAYANTTMCYRDEQTGELSGLSRVRAFTQDDAHVFCRLNQAEAEILKIWDMIEAFYKAVHFPLSLRLSLHDPKHPEKYLGKPAQWKSAEAAMRTIAKSKKMEFFEAPGEAAFYGPKLDFIGKDSLGRPWQVATIQMDFNQPERFDLTCADESGKPERIVMIHAAIMGSIERFLSIMIEHFAGAFPTWLAPEQVRILAVSEKFELYCLEVRDALRARGIRATLVESNETLGKRIRESDIQKVPYSLIVGEKEIEAKTVNVRKRGAERGTDRALSVEEFISEIEREIETKA